MGGVAGLWHRGGAAVEPDALVPMLAAIRHRGPDAVNTWHRGQAALALCGFTTIDPTYSGGQPTVTADGKGALVFDGEIYNHAPLREKLKNAGVPSKSEGVTEVILEAFRHWGPAAAIPQLNGMFAIAYVDPREPALWLARDRVGIKPLVTTTVGSTFLFASEAKALIAHPRMRASVDRAALVKILIEEKYCGPLSMLDGVESVEAGCIWKVTREDIHRERYFDVPRAIEIDQILRSERANPAGFVTAFAEKLRRSVADRLISSAPVAVTCSGGVDSGLITAFARDIKRDIVAYVVDAPPSRGEGAAAERLGRHLGVEVRRVPLDRERFLQLWPQSVWHGATSDRPANYPNAPASLALSKACAADGFKALLSGQGADALFGEQRNFYVNRRQWYRLAWLARLTPVKSFRRRLETLTRVPLADMAGERNPTLHTKFAMTLDGYHAFLGHRLFAALAGVKHPGDRAFLADCLLHFCNTTPWLVERHERMGMAASIEMRFPFLDNDLIDFAINLPRRAKLHRGEGKWVAKAAASAVLPREALVTKKTGFAIPSSYYAGTERLLTGGMLADTLGWSLATTEAIVAALATEDNLRFFAVGIELWLRLYLDGETSEGLAERLLALPSAQ